MKIRKLQPCDADGMLSWMHDDTINKVFQCDFKSFTKEKVTAFIKSAADESESLHRACTDDNGEYLGTVSLKHIDNEAKNAEYAVSFCAKAHGTGAAAFATREILRIAFEELGLHRVYLNVISENARANAFYKKMGFIYEGTFKQHILVNGKLCDLNWYRMLKEEFK